MTDKPYIIIPTNENGKWTETPFQTKEDFRLFINSLFKEPGKYEFDETSLLFNAEARKFNEHRIYCISAKGTMDFVEYWDDQKNKCRAGTLFINNGKQWYIPRDYYMWLNFLPIYNKEINKYGFADVRDAQYHLSLYELLAELHGLHAAILKKRQIASSYYHCGKFINQLWFEEGVTLKMGASLKDYINEKGNWKFLEEYRSFLNTHTAWYRPMNPAKVMMWQQKVEMTVGLDKRKVETGLKGTIQGVTFDKDPTTGVGGPCKYFYHEEAGIAPKMNVTKEYLMPAMKSGQLYTGTFIAAGSVGDLSQCGPLKDLIEYPVDNDIYPVETNLIDDTGMIGLSGLFIPEQWSMPPYIDEYGNSLVEEALTALDVEFAEWKKKLSPEAYQLRISQHPRNIKEAFASRKIAKFPKHLVEAQMRRIKDKEYAIEYMDIFRNAEGLPELKHSNKAPISEFPIRKDLENKEGVICIYERPVKNPVFRTYYASIDPVGEGKTTTSDSLCSIFIYKNTTEIRKHNGQEGEVIETYVEHGKIVASWCGRYDDIDKTHERLELLLELYNAWALVENNVGLFIQHMIKRRKQRYLVPKDQIMFLKDLGANKTVYQDYGWKNTGTLFKTHMLSYGIEFLQEEIDHELKPDGTIVRTTYGVERIPDIMLLTEMEQYEEGLNVDRLIAYCALISFIRIQDANIGYRKEDITVDLKNLDKSKIISKLDNSPFRHIGGQNSTVSTSVKRSPYKNLK
jgi:hypothetical protein